MGIVPILAILLFRLPDSIASHEQRTVVVTGATGRTGSLLYKRLVAEGLWKVRALVRNSTKAKKVLGCEACDESEGVFKGDITNASSLSRVMSGADALAVVTASTPKCSGIPFGPFGKCTYPKGGEPKVIDWQGTKAQVVAFASAEGSIASKQVLYVSTMDTTVPNNFLDRLDHGYVSFYHLQAEAAVMSSGIPFTIAKACGLGDGAAGKHKLIVGHDDASFSLLVDHTIARDDVARVLVEAIRAPSASAGLRFDLCSQELGRPTTDISKDVFQAARFPWQLPTQVAAAFK